MKKIVYGYANSFDIIDPKDYIIIEKDNQRISDKYVDFRGNKINEYRDEDEIEKGDIVIRGLYEIDFGFLVRHISVNFRKFKCYDTYRSDEEYTPELKQGIRAKNSVFDFDDIKDQIVKIFSRDIEIEIK